MSLLQQCGICGQGMLSGDLTSDPSAHFCGFELNGAAIVRPGVVSVDKMDSVPSTPGSSSRSSFDSDVHTTGAVTAIPRNSIHHPADLAEIGRLHMENEALKASRLATPRYTPAITFSLPAGEHATREVSLPDGESVMVEVAVHAK